MAKTKPTKRDQLGVSFPPEVRSLLDELIEKTGFKITPGAYLQTLVKQEAERQGIKPKKK